MAAKATLRGATLRGATLRGATLRGATRILAAKGNSLFPAVIPIKDENVTKLYLRNTTANGISIGGVACYDLLTTAGSSTDTAVVTTTASGTEIQFTKTAGGSIAAFITGRVPVGGWTITSSDVALWLQESAATVNAGLRFRLFKYSGGTETELGGSPFSTGTEFNTGSTLTTLVGNVTDTALAEDDRLLLRIYAVNVGTMAAGTATLSFNGAVGGSSEQRTFYPDAANGNPRFGFGTSTSWAACRSNATSDPVEYPSNEVVLQGELAGATYIISRIGYVFDTAIIPDTETVISASFFVYSTTTGDGSETTNPANGALVGYTPSSDTAPTTSDYQQFGTTRFADTDVTRTNFNASSAYKEWVLNATGLAAISKTGNTRLGIRPSNDFSDATAPTARSYALGYYAAQTGTANDPKLVVTSTSVSSADSYINVYPAVSFKAESGGTIIDLSAASFGFTKQNPQLRVTVGLNIRSFIFTGQAAQAKLLIAATTASLSFSAKTLQNRATSSLSTAALSFSAKTVQLKNTITNTIASLDFSAKTLQMRLSNNLTAATLNFSAKVIEAFNSGGTVVVDLASAVFSFSAKTLQTKVTIPLSLAVLTFSAKTLQLRATVGLALANLLTSAKSLQLKATVALSAAQNILTAQAISAKLVLTTTVANTLRFISSTIQNRLNVSITTGSLYFLSQVVDVVGEGAAAVVVRFRYSMTRFRQLLKGRKY